MKQIVLGRHNSELRFELVKIAFEKTLEVQIQFADPNEMGRGIVALADAVLAAMGTDAISPTEKLVAAAEIIPLLRQRIENELADQGAFREKHLTQDEKTAKTNQMTQAFRRGVGCGLERAIAIVKRMEMEKPEEPRPACRATLEFVRCSVQSYLDSKLYHWRCFPANQEEDVRGHRNGVRHACNNILKIIVAEIEKPEAETDDAK